ncbi:MAG: GH25 family lysozyme [Bacteroidota bacterium]
MKKKYFGIVAIICITLFYACADAKKDETKTTDTTTKKASPQETSTPAEPAFGIDISVYQGDEVETFTEDTKLQFIICKATEGVTYTDPKFTENWTTIKEKGYIRGAYHFYRSNDDPKSQALFFLDAIKDIRATDIPPVVDVEQSGITQSQSVAEIQQSVLQLLQIIEQQSNRIPIIYTNTEFAIDYLNTSEFANYPLWIADYTSADEPEVPSVWKEIGYTFWQKSDNYKLDDYTDDADVFNGSADALRKFIQKTNILIK